MRVSTTPRAVKSVGELTTSENAFIMSLMAALQFGGAAAEHVLQLLEALQAGAVACIGGRCGVGLAGQQVAAVAQHGLDVHTFADVAAPSELAGHGGQHHVLARIACGVDVGDVVQPAVWMAAWSASSAREPTFKRLMVYFLGIGQGA